MYAERADELALAAAGLADLPERRALVPVEHQNALRVEVGYVQLVTLDRHPCGHQVLIPEGGDMPILGAEHEDPTEAAVDDVLHAVVGDGDVGGLGHLLDAARHHQPRLPLVEIEDDHCRVGDVADVDAPVPHLDAIRLANGQRLNVPAEDDPVEDIRFVLDVGADGERAEELDAGLVGTRRPEGVGAGSRSVGPSIRRGGAATHRCTDDGDKTAGHPPVPAVAVLWNHLSGYHYLMWQVRQRLLPTLVTLSRLGTPATAWGVWQLEQLTTCSPLNGKRGTSGKKPPPNP